MKHILLILSVLIFMSEQVFAQIPDSLEVIGTDEAVYEGNVLEQDSLNIFLPDSSLVVEEKLKSDYPNPKRAAFLGLAIPGAGHIYNKRNWWWKVPVVYGGLIGGIWSIQYNQSRFNITRDVHCVKLINAGTAISERSRCADLIIVDENDPSIRTINEAELSRASRRNPSGIYTNLVASDRYDAQSVRNLRDSFDKNLQLSWIGIVAGHLILNGAWSFVDAHLNDFDMNDDLSLKIKPNIQQIPMSTTPFLGTSVVLAF
ncbi:MAG: DUF5683 domain-containing protein [Bacteroidota bacterium]